MDDATPTRERLIKATVEVVRDLGYAHTTTRAIARAAGVAEGTIYRHFPDKNALFVAAVLDRNAPIIEWVSHLPDRAGQGSVAENLTACLTRLAGLREDIVPLELAVIADPQLAHQHRQHAAAALAGGPLPGPPHFVAAYLAAEQALGRVRADVDPQQVAVVLLATLFGIALAPLPIGSPEESLLAGAVRLLVQGIGPR